MVCLVIITRRRLHDHLKEGKYSTKTPLLKKDASFVNTTNVVCECNFGVLDRLMRIKAKALDFVYEGLIMFSKNKTNLWRDQLSKEQLEMAMESARKSKQKQKELCIQRKKEIFQKKALCLQANVVEKQQKDKLLALEMEVLVKGGVGGRGGEVVGFHRCRKETANVLHRKREKVCPKSAV